jgi:hypothetical protein
MQHAVFWFWKLIRKEKTILTFVLLKHLNVNLRFLRRTLKRYTKTQERTGIKRPLRRIKRPLKHSIQKKPKGPEVSLKGPFLDILYWRLQKPLGPALYFYYGQSAPAKTDRVQIKKKTGRKLIGREPWRSVWDERVHKMAKELFISHILLRTIV